MFKQNIFIDQLWTSQRSLKRFEQVPFLVELIKTEKEFTSKIEIVQTSENLLVIKNGHHRVMAIWFCGRQELKTNEYEIIYSEMIPLLPMSNLIKYYGK